MSAIGDRYGRDFSLAQLEYAVTTRETGSFSAAARSCHVSQPALSSGIAALEQTLGVRLFDRSTRGATPTQHGQRLLTLIEAILSGSEELFTAASQISRERPTVRLGVSPLLSPDLIAQTFEAIRETPSGCEVTFDEANLEQLGRDLVTGQLDLILAPRVKTGLSSVSQRVIYTESLRYVRRLAGSDDEQDSEVELRDLDGVNLVLVTEECGLTAVTQEALWGVGARPSTSGARATSYQRLLEWADLGLGDAVLPASRVPADRASALLVNAGQPVVISYEAIWVSNSPNVELIGAIVGTLCSGLEASR